MFVVGRQDVMVSLIHETFSAHQKNDMNMIRLDGLVVGHAVALELVKTFLQAKFNAAERFQRRLMKVAAMERKEAKS